MVKLGFSIYFVVAVLTIKLSEFLKNLFCKSCNDNGIQLCIVIFLNGTQGYGIVFASKLFMMTTTPFTTPKFFCLAIFYALANSTVTNRHRAT